MLVQQDWYDLIKPTLALVELRLPYPRPDGRRVLNIHSGYILKPIWGPASSTETGLYLIIYKLSGMLKWYEEAMAYFNQTLRVYCFY